MVAPTPLALLALLCAGAPAALAVRLTPGGGGGGGGTGGGGGFDDAPGAGDRDPTPRQHASVLNAVLSDPDRRTAGGGDDDSTAMGRISGGRGGPTPGTHAEVGRTIQSSGSRVARLLGDVEAKRWALDHGLVDDPETVKDGLGDTPYGFKRESVINTDDAVRKMLTPAEYDHVLSRGEMDPADLRGLHKHADSTVPDSSDPAGRYGSKLYSPGDPRVTLDSYAPSDEFRGEHDPEAIEIRKRNKKRAVKIGILSVPEHRFVESEPRAPGDELGGTTNWDDLTAGVHDTDGTRVTDPKVLATGKANGALSDTLDDTAGPGDRSLRGAPTFDQGFHDLRDTEFSNPVYHSQGMTTKYIRGASEVPNDPKEPNYEGLVTDPRSGN
jgi:hypothetical protein